MRWVLLFRFGGTLLSYHSYPYACKPSHYLRWFRGHKKNGFSSGSTRWLPLFCAPFHCTHNPVPVSRRTLSFQQWLKRLPALDSNQGFRNSGCAEQGHLNVFFHLDFIPFKHPEVILFGDPISRGDRRKSSLPRLISTRPASFSPN